MNLSDVIDRTPGLRLIRGEVEQVTGDTITLSYLGGSIDHVATLDQYNPVVNDIVIVIVWPKGGYLAIGSNNGTTAETPSVPVPPYTLTVNADGVSTYVLDAAGNFTWLGSTLEQGEDRALCWFYDTGLFSSMTGALLASFEVEITLTSGGPPELLLHGNPSAVGELVQATPTWYLPDEDDVPLGVATWVPVPVGWGEMLANGQASGVGIGLGQHTGTYTGTGRLRFTTV